MMMSVRHPDTMATSNRPDYPFTCTFCKKTVDRPPRRGQTYRVSDLGRRDGDFCSKACMLAHAEAQR